MNVLGGVSTVPPTTMNVVSGPSAAPVSPIPLTCVEIPPKTLFKVDDVQVPSG